MAELADFLKRLQSQSSSTGKENQSNDGKMLNLCSNVNRGTASIRIIKDELGEYMRVMNYAFEVYEETPALNPDGTQKVGKDGKPWSNYSTHVILNPDPKYGNFCSNLLKLTPEQYQLVSDCYEAIRMYDNLVQKKIIDPSKTPTKLSVKFRKQIYLFWGKVLNLSDATGKSIIKTPEVRLLKHVSQAFGTNLSAAINARTNALQDGGRWFGSYCDRTPGMSNHIMSLTTDLNNGTIGYSALFQFLDGAEFELTDTDISYCTDLNSQVADITRFDAAFYSSLKDRVVEVLQQANAQQQQALGLAPAESPAAPSVNPNTLIQPEQVPVTETIVNPANVYPNAAPAQPAPEYTTTQSAPVYNTPSTTPNPTPAYAPTGFQMPTTNL